MSTTEVWYTATLAVETAAGRRWCGVSYAGTRGPLRYANEDGERLPRGASVRYRTPLRRLAHLAYEQARSRTIHHNLYHRGDMRGHLARYCHKSEAAAS